MYTPTGSQAISAPTPITPFNVRVRSHSMDRFGLGLGISDLGSGTLIPPRTPTSGKFVGLLVVRQQTKVVLLKDGPVPPATFVGKKVAVGKLVAFFNHRLCLGRFKERPAAVKIEQHRRRRACENRGGRIHEARRRSGPRGHESAEPDEMARGVTQGE